MKKMGTTIWKGAIGGLVPLKNKSKFSAQREEKKNNALSLKTIISGLSSPIKESMGQCTSAKDLWLKLEETYQIKKEKEDIEDHSIKITKGKESPKKFQVKINNQVMIAQRKILKTFQMKSKNYVLVLEKRMIVIIFQMKVKNPKKCLIAMMMMMNCSLQVKKIKKQFV
jgi:hypothetical protein